MIPRWLFLRGLGFIYFSAFFSLVFQIRGLVGPEGILPANDYLQAVVHSFGHARLWFAPTVFRDGLRACKQMCSVILLCSISHISVAPFPEHDQGLPER
jgi:hypothetical protein